LEIVLEKGRLHLLLCEVFGSSAAFIVFKSS
jgi:hypothetical protein